MKVKVGNKIYSSDDEPIVIVFDTNEEQYHIVQMQDLKKIVYYPSDKYSEEEIELLLNSIRSDMEFQGGDNNVSTNKGD